MRAVFGAEVRSIYGFRDEAVETEGRRRLLASEGDAGVLVEYVEEAEREQPRRSRGSTAAVGIHG